MLHTGRNILGSFLLLVAPIGVQAQGFDTSARMAFVMDYETGAVLLDRNSNISLPPASMSKLMTLNMLFEALADNRVSLDEEVPVSERAWAMGGSSMFLEPRHRPTFEDLIRGIIVHSGNDACVVVAEALAGSEEEFARQMTARARQLGMRHSTFTNSTGWPDEGHLMSGEDLVFLAQRLIEEFPQFYSYFQEREFTWNDIQQPNRNPLLYLDIGADGLKTGHTEEAGYGLVGSAMRDGRRVLFVISGLDSSAARSRESERIVNWAFRNYTNTELFTAGTRIAEADVWLGEAATVALVAEQDVIATLPFTGQDQIEARVELTASPLPAPIEAGQYVGDLIIEGPDTPRRVVPLVTQTAVAEAGVMARVMVAANMMLSDFISQE